MTKEELMRRAIELSADSVRNGGRSIWCCHLPVMVKLLPKEAMV